MGLLETVPKVGLDPCDYGYKKVPHTLPPLPLDSPSFTLKQIRAAIPPHCLERSALKSSVYLTLDLLLFFGSLWVAVSYGSELPLSLQLIFWPSYWALQGVFMTGIFVVGHEAGHGAYSEYTFVNDAVGWFCHSLLLTPYIAFKEGHRKHHQFAGNCEHDEIFVPPSRKQLEEERENEELADWREALEDTPLYNFGWMLYKFVIFYPAHILFAQYRLEKYKGLNMNLFSPACALYTPGDFTRAVLISDFGIIVVVTLCVDLVTRWGFSDFVLRLLVPYLVFNFYFALATFLQHTDVYLPRFREPEWSWLKGALCTVDRSMGFILDAATHHIMDTHVIHHMCPKIPFYHAQEATREVSKVLGEYYKKDDTPIFFALMRSFTKCKFIEDKGTILFCKQKLSE